MEGNDIEVIISNAASSKSDEDYNVFFDAIRNREIFFSIKDGEADGAGVRVPLVSLGNGLTAIVFHTTKNESRLGQSYGGMVWERALDMALKMQGVDGIVVQGVSDAWIGMAKAKIEELVALYSVDAF